MHIELCTLAELPRLEVVIRMLLVAKLLLLAACRCAIFLAMSISTWAVHLNVQLAAAVRLLTLSLAGRALVSFPGQGCVRCGACSPLAHWSERRWGAFGRICSTNSM